MNETICSGDYSFEFLTDAENKIIAELAAFPINCANHADTAAETLCAVCRKPFCRECLEYKDKKSVCRTCVIENSDGIRTPDKLFDSAALFVYKHPIAFAAIVLALFGILYSGLKSAVKPVEYKDSHHRVGFSAEKIKTLNEYLYAARLLDKSKLFENIGDKSKSRSLLIKSQKNFEKAATSSSDKFRILNCQIEIIKIDLKLQNFDSAINKIELLQNIEDESLKSYASPELQFFNAQIEELKNSNYKAAIKNYKNYLQTRIQSAQSLSVAFELFKNDCSVELEYDCDIYFYIGRCYFMINKFDKADEYFKSYFEFAGKSRFGINEDYQIAIKKMRDTIKAAQ